MAYWLTVQWPPLKNKEMQKPSGVYLREENILLADKLSPGDKVFFYQTKKGPVQIDNDGNRFTCEPGRCGIVELATIASIRHDEYQPETRLKYGKINTYRWICVADLVQRDQNGFVSLKDVNLIVFTPQNPMRSIGRNHSGLRDLEEDQYQKLVRAFKGGAV